jgi:hypothetical protein
MEQLTGLLPQDSHAGLVGPVVHVQHLSAQLKLACFG